MFFSSISFFSSPWSARVKVSFPLISVVSAGIWSHAFPHSLLLSTVRWFIQYSWSYRILIETSLWLPVSISLLPYLLPSLPPSPHIATPPPAITEWHFDTSQIETKIVKMYLLSTKLKTQSLLWHIRHQISQFSAPKTSSAHWHQNMSL